MFKTTPAILATGLILTVSCTKSISLSDNHIRMVSTVYGTTKGARLTTDNLSEFSLDVISGGDSNWAGASGATYLNSVPVKLVGASWETFNSTGTEIQDYFWVDNSLLYFWSHAPYRPNGDFSIISQSPVGSESEMVFTFAPASDPADQDDLILAYSGEKRECSGESISSVESTNPRDGLADNEVAAIFYHALSEISFCVSTDDNTFSNDLSIVSISLEGIAGSGQCCYDGSLADEGFSWTPSTGTASYTLDLNTNFASDPAGDSDDWSTGTFNRESNTYNLFTTKNLLYVIPQDLSSSTTARIAVTFHRTSNNETATKRIAIDDTWLPGYYYKYKIKASKVGADIYLSYVLLVDDWINGTDNLIL